VVAAADEDATGRRVIDGEGAGARRRAARRLGLPPAPATVRSRDRGDQRADVLEGHLSTALVHMANVSYRLGTHHSAAEARDALRDRGNDAVETFERFQAHLEANGVDFAKTKVVVGPWLEMDPATERFVGHSDIVERANGLLRREYRAPFVIPEKV